MGDDFVAHNGVKVEQDDYDSLIGRLGVRSGFYFPEKKGNIYARVAVLHDFMGDMEATASKANAAGVCRPQTSRKSLATLGLNTASALTSISRRTPIRLLTLRRLPAAT